MRRSRCWWPSAYERESPARVNAGLRLPPRLSGGTRQARATIAAIAFGKVLRLGDYSKNRVTHGIANKAINNAPRYAEP